MAEQPDEYVVYVVELQDRVPRREANKANVFVGAFRLQNQDELFRSLGRRAHSIGTPVRILAKLRGTSPFENKEAARELRDKTATGLARRGFTVNPVPAQPRRIYVLELDTKFGPGGGMGWIYVGETGKPIDERIAEHVSGRKSSRVVKKFFVRRRLDLEPPLPIYSVWDSTAEETRWGRHLQRMGFDVTGPQGL